jgi:hypothetical protein
VIVKLNLTLDAPERIGGYVNIDPYGEADIRGGVGNLDAYVDDSECEALLARDVLDYFRPSDVGDVLDNWVRKLRRGGQITIGGVDIQEVARKLATREIDLHTANRFLYGDQSAPWQGRKATISLDHLGEVLISRGLKVTRRSLNGCFYEISAERP